MSQKAKTVKRPRLSRKALDVLVVIHDILNKVTDTYTKTDDKLAELIEICHPNCEKANDVR